METLKITKADLNERNEYARSRDLEFEGHIEIEANLGQVVVLGFIRTAGYLGIAIRSGVEAGGSIEAAWSIEAGFSVQCKLSISAKRRIFAGLCAWRLPEPEQQVIECAELAQGTVCSGHLKLLPAKKEII
jgi:hypothetical protein